MRRQRNMAQMKEQIKTPEKELNETDRQSIRCRVQTLVIRMLKELSENLNSIKNTQSKTKETLTEIANSLQGNSIMDEAKNQINDMEH